ncbi:MAG: hypothetical protein WCE63_08295 [Acidobacteriaceae bacterium]
MARLSREAKELLQLVPPDGGFIGNTSLQRKSKLRKRYWAIRQELLDGEYLDRGKGRGGSVARAAIHAKVPREGKRGNLNVRRESELYEPLARWLKEEWGKDVDKAGGDFFQVLVTGSPRGRLRATGKWTRPDVTLVELNSYEYLHQRILDVTTFEVKKFSDAENLLSVFEAAAHSRWAHYSYLVVESRDADDELPERFTSELERFHIGLIYMWKEKGEWQFDRSVYETNRLAPEPKELNALLTEFFRIDKSRASEFKRSLGKA